MNSDLEKRLKKASYMWEEDKNQYVLLEFEMENSNISTTIYHVPTRSIELIEDYELDKEIIARMREAGVRIIRNGFPD
ncbi:MAG: hypothetical protein RLP44_19800 [Aggregatilineales bacterium]